LNRDILRILNLEADGGVHESIRRHAAATGLALVFERAASRGEFEAALRRGGVDLILASHTVPGFGGTEALESAREIAPGVPYVIVSDSIGEDRAAECLRRGAVDFVHKDRLERLPAAIERATRDAPQRGPRMEADLLHAQKMELVGRLAGGFAHEFNNLLTIISGYVSMLLDRDSLPPEPSEALQRVFTASRRAAGLVNQL